MSEATPLATVEQCSNCRFWKKLGLTRGVDAEQGLCRKRSPRPYLLYSDQEGPIGSVWPETDEDDWCGEYQPVRPKVNDGPLAALDLSIRARRIMELAGIKTLGQLTDRTIDEMLELRNLGMTTLHEVRLKLGQKGLRLKGDQGGGLD